MSSTSSVAKLGVNVRRGAHDEVVAGLVTAVDSTLDGEQLPHLGERLARLETVGTVEHRNHVFRESLGRKTLEGYDGLAVELHVVALAGILLAAVPYVRPRYENSAFVVEVEICARHIVLRGVLALIETAGSGARSLHIRDTHGHVSHAVLRYDASVFAFELIVRGTSGQGQRGRESG